VEERKIHGPSADANARGEILIALMEATPNFERNDPVFIEALHHEDRKVRWEATHRLAGSGCTDEAAIPLLIKELQDTYTWFVQEEHERFRKAMAEVDQFEYRPESYCPYYEYKVPAHHAAVLLALAKFGPTAAAAIPAILQLQWEHRASCSDGTGSNYVWIDDALDEALQQIGSGAISTLVEALGQGEPAFGRAARTLRTLGHSAKAVPGLIKALASDEAAVRCKAAEIIGEFGVEAGDAAPDLIKALSHPDAEFHTLVLAAFGELGEAGIKSMQDVFADNATAREPTGIERMGAQEIFEVIEQLRMFRQIGDLCRTRGSDSFSFDTMADELFIGRATIRRRMEAVSAFFRRYFKRFEERDVPEDDDGIAGPSNKFLHRRQGKQPTICALGWRAWEETCRYLNTIDPDRKA